MNELKKSVPECKIAVFCDETAYPGQAREVIRAKQTGKTDAFFYASVTAEYLTAAPDSSDPSEITPETAKNRRQTRRGAEKYRRKNR